MSTATARTKTRQGGAAANPQHPVRQSRFWRPMRVCDPIHVLEVSEQNGEADAYGRKSSQYSTGKNRAQRACLRAGRGWEHLGGGSEGGSETSG